MRKLIFCFFTSFVLLASPVLAVGPNDNAQIPERNGDYADPEHPGVRVRVFVHEPRKPDADVPATCDDPNSSAAVHAAGWKLPSGSWSYNLNPSSVPASVGSSNLSTIASNGFNRWQNAQNRVTFNEGSNTTVTRNAYDGQNIITWGRTSGNALAVTYVRYYKTSKIVVDVDTIMNVKFPWSWTPYTNGGCGDPTTYDAQAVLTHEEGHWLGLDDEYTSAYVNNTMYGYGFRGDIKADTLTTGDINGVKAIY